MFIHKQLFFRSPDKALRNPGRRALDLTRYSRILQSYIAYRDVGKGREQERKLPGYKAFFCTFMDGY